jgi:hypothetical protein
MRHKTAGEIIRDLETRIARLEREATYVEFDGKLYNEQDIARMDPFTREKFIKKYPNPERVMDQLRAAELADQLSQTFYNMTEPVSSVVGKMLQAEFKKLGGVVRYDRRTGDIVINVIGNKSMDIMDEAGFLQKMDIKKYLSVGNQIIRRVLSRKGRGKGFDQAMVEGEHYELTTLRAGRGGEAGLYDLNKNKGVTHRITFYPGVLSARGLD